MANSDSEKSVNSEDYKNNKIHDRTFGAFQANKYNQKVSTLLNDRDMTTIEKNEYGEITGMNQEQDKHDMGLPFRGGYSMRRKRGAQKELRNDFDVMEKKAKMVNIQPMDNTGNIANIDEGMEILSENNDPFSVYKKSLNKFGKKILDVFKRQNDYCVSVLGLNLIFCILYIMSNGVSEQELKTFLNVPDKELTKNFVFMILNAMKNNDSVRIKNFLFFSNDIPFNNKGLELLNSLLHGIQINTNDDLNVQANKLAKFININMKHEMRNVIVPDNLSNLQSMLLTCAVINPSWIIPFNGIVKNKFNGNICNFLYAKDMIYPYYEDNDIQMIELPFGNSNNRLNCVFGMILPKAGNTITLDEIYNHTKNMKQVKVNELYIPMISKTFKYRLINVIKNMGLNGIFHNYISKYLFESPIQIQDIVMNISVILTNNMSKMKYSPKQANYQNNYKFVATKSFYYYVRILDINLILVNGMMS